MNNTGTDGFNFWPNFLAQIRPERIAEKRAKKGGKITKIIVNNPPIRTGGLEFSEIPHARNIEKNKQRNGFK